jgi:hypothetical protein
MHEQSRLRWERGNDERYLLGTFRRSGAFVLFWFAPSRIQLVWLGMLGAENIVILGDEVDRVEDGEVTRREDGRHLVASKRKYGMGESRKQIERKRKGNFMRSIVG